MSLRLGSAFANGIRRVLTRTGGILLVSLLVLQLLVQVSINTAVLGVFPPEGVAQLEGQLGLTLPVPAGVAAALLVLALLLNAAFFVTLARGLTRPIDQLGSFPESLYTRRIGRATLSVLGMGIVTGVAVSIGFIFLILPGLFFAICFLFAPFEVGVGDKGAGAALKKSWARSRGNRLQLAVIVILAGVIGAVIGAVGAIFDVARAAVAGDVVANLLSTILFVGLYGIIADAYVQIRGDEYEAAGGSGAATPAQGGVASDQY
jgi:hypothetical protein